MLAKLKQDCRYPTLSLFFGREYTKTEWRAVPDGFEAQAKESAYLDVEEVAQAKESVIIPAAPGATIPALDVSEVTTLEDNAPALTEVNATAPRMNTRNRHGGK